RNPAAFLKDLIFCGRCREVLHAGGDDRSKRNPDKHCLYFCSSYHKKTVVETAAASLCRRNTINHNEAMKYVRDGLAEMGIRLDLLMQEVDKLLKSGGMPDSRKAKADEYWAKYLDGVARLVAYLWDHHPDEYTTMLRELDQQARENEAGVPSARTR